MWKLMFRGVLAAFTLIVAMSLPAAGQTSIDTSRRANAIVIVDDAEYSFSGKCLLMSRGDAIQVRMSVSGYGPNGEHVHLALYATSFAPSQFTIYSGSDPEAARVASVQDDRPAWLVRGGGSPDGVRFSPSSISADMMASVYSDGEQAVPDASVQLEITGC